MLSPQTTERLNRFKNSDKFNRLSPETQDRLNRFIDVSAESQPSQQSELQQSLGQKLRGGLENTGEILSGGFKRQFNAGPTSLNTITGGPATEFAHGVKTEAMTRLGTPEIVAEAASSATDPQMVLGSFITKMGMANARHPGVLDRMKAMKTSAKGRATVSRLLPAAKISEDLESGRPSGVQVEGFNIIKKTKNPQDIVNKFRNERNKVIDTVDKYVEENNKPVSPEKIRNRAEEILGKQFSNSSDDEIGALRASIDEEVNHMPLDTKSANSRKRFLYEKTEKLQQAQRKGLSNVNRPEQSLVEDAFAQAYKEAVEEAHPDIAPTNQRFSGLNEGVKASSRLVEGELEQVPTGERAASQAIGRNNLSSMIAALVRELPFIGSSPRRLTSIIDKLNKKHGKLLMRSREDQAPGLLGREFFEPTPRQVSPKNNNPMGYSGPTSQIEIPPDRYSLPGRRVLPEESELGYVAPNKRYVPSIPQEKTPVATGIEYQDPGISKGYSPKNIESSIGRIIEDLLGYKGPTSKMNIPVEKVNPKVPYNDPGVAYKDPGKIKLSEIIKRSSRKRKK